MGVSQAEGLQERADHHLLRTQRGVRRGTSQPFTAQRCCTSLFLLLGVHCSNHLLKLGDLTLI